MRVDQWLWAVRIFKSRSLATEAARRGQISIDGRAAKAATLVRLGQTVEVIGRLKGVSRRVSLEVIGTPPSRISANRVPEFCLLKHIPAAESPQEPSWWNNSEWWGELEPDSESDS
jgi:ribosome-associated heat shock protein Hsp15